MATSANQIAVSSRNANLIGSQSVPYESFRTNLMYYEMRLDRQLTHAYLLLHQLQHPESSKSPTILSKKRESTQNEPISAR